jgi:hypothetical protein
VAIEIDLPFTLIAGSNALAEHLIGQRGSTQSRRVAGNLMANAAVLQYVILRQQSLPSDWFRVRRLPCARQPGP